MAKGVSGTAPPVESLDARLMSWGAGEIMYRVHDAVYTVDSFNPSPLGSARFSPIYDSDGEVIPTLYAVTTPQGALMETIFHDVPYKPGFKRVSASRLEGKLTSTLVFSSDFQLIDLGKIGLRRLGIQPHELIDTTKAHYPETRKRAEMLFAAYTHKRSPGSMLIRSAPKAEGGELGGYDAWRSEYRGSRCETGTGGYCHDTCEFDVHRDENMPIIRETIESATGADSVTAIRSHRMRVFEDGLVRRSDCEGNTITQIAMRRVGRKPEQQRAE